MASLSGSSPDTPRQIGRTGVRWRRLSLGLSLLLTTAGLAGMPDSLREALKKFKAEVPGGWAYTLKTERAGRQITERFNPSNPPAGQWTLLLTDGRTPTPEEQSKYFKSKASQTPGAVPAIFQKNDLEPGSVELVREDPERAEYRCQFREQAANSDKMLGHLGLRLIVSKRELYIEKFTMELREPYSPVLGVKMRELVVAMSFAPPGDDRPCLPVHSSSHFLGRIFFVPVEENLRVTYSDFTHGT